MLGRGGGTPEPRASAIEAGAGCLLEATGAEIVCVTLDRDGAVILSRNSPPERVPASSPTVAYTNGAGDTFTPTVINICCYWLFQIPLAYWLALRTGLGARGVFLAITAAESLIAVVGVLAFRRGTWKASRI